MASSDDDRRMRAELSAELGYFPASFDPADIERHRRQNAFADRAPTMDKIHRKYAHLREAKRRAEAEAAGRAAVADLYE